MSIFKPRRKMVVNREVQYDVLMYVGVFVVALFIVQVFTAYLFLDQVQRVVGTMSALEFIARYKISFLVYQIIPVSFSLIVGVYIFNRLTSRIAGPLFNMRRILQKARNGELETAEIKLRENDYFQEEINDINVILKRKSD
ncbi:HAMP domain-containing protein [Bdellovibrio sp. BCCA]|uniref:HAMP domain-containing protein n=1 Tax=Bdellovibrio sp. BCCA TaxID=3136281 RepID=UPI0030F1AA82